MKINKTLRKVNEIIQKIDEIPSVLDEVNRIEASPYHIVTKYGAKSKQSEWPATASEGQKSSSERSKSSRKSQP